MSRTGQILGTQKEQEWEETTKGRQPTCSEAATGTLSLGSDNRLRDELVDAKEWPGWGQGLSRLECSGGSLSYREQSGLLRQNILEHEEKKAHTCMYDRVALFYSRNGHNQVSQLQFFFFFFFFVLLGLLPRQMEVPRLGVELEL